MIGIFMLDHFPYLSTVYFLYTFSIIFAKIFGLFYTVESVHIYVTCLVYDNNAYCMAQIYTQRCWLYFYCVNKYYRLYFEVNRVIGNVYKYMGLCLWIN